MRKELGGGGFKVLVYCGRGVFGLEGERDFFKIVQVNIQFCNLFFDGMEVAPEVSIAQVKSCQLRRNILILR